MVPILFSTGEDSPPRLDKDLCEYLLPDNSEEFAYVFRNGEWVCYNTCNFNLHGITCHNHIAYGILFPCYSSQR
jgi:hypothetical protein